MRRWIWGVWVACLGACGQLGYEAIDAGNDAPVDAQGADGADTLDAGVDAVTSDVPIADVSVDVPTDVPPDVPSDAGDDAGPECSSDADCPAAASVCEAVSCVDGTCNRSAINEGGACDDGEATTMSVCMAARCVSVGCVAGLGDCDRVLANGCETTVNTTTHCGACGNYCYVTCAGTECDRVVDVAISENARVCAVLASGAVACATPASPVFAPAPEFPRIKRFEEFFTRCFVDAADAVSCWGSNFAGQVGDGTTTDRPAPLRVPGLGPASDITLDNSFVCALLLDGSTWCWGHNGFGQLGQGTMTGQSSVPLEVVGLTDVVSLHAGNTHVFALLSTGRIMSWGLSSRIGRMGAAALPGPVDGISTATAVAAGFVHGCALLADGSLRCWGENHNGEVGGPMAGPTARYELPIDVPLRGIASWVALGDNHTCVVIGGEVDCFGINNAGQLGDDTGGMSTTPRRVPGLAGVVELHIVGATTCGLTSRGEVYCWGGAMGTSPILLSPI